MNQSTHSPDAGAMHSTRAQVVSDVKAAVASAEAMLQEAARVGGDEARSLREKADVALSRAASALHHAGEVTVAKSKAAARRTDDWVHDHPWRAVGIAAGVGVVLGLLINRR
jgi:ElaB/YqjD/DUF883 family membrane-anchored ribosome-binding protein